MPRHAPIAALHASTDALPAPIEHVPAPGREAVHGAARKCAEIRRDFEQWVRAIRP
jgi:hypothetical protein